MITRSLHILVCLVCLIGFSCKGQKKEPLPETKDTANYLLPQRPQGYVSDFSQILTGPQIQHLDSLLAAHEKETTNQVVVITLDPDTSQVKTREDFDKFSLHLFNQWGVGQKGKNNGVGLLVSTGQRKVRIEVGLGLEAKLTDEEAKQIIDSILLPAFREGDYYRGISSAAEAIIREIK